MAVVSFGTMTAASTGRTLRHGWHYQRVPVGSSGKTTRANVLAGSINGFKSNIIRIEEDQILIAQLTNHKEPDNQIMQAWGTVDVASRILAIVYDQEYEMPKKSAAYAVFRAILESGPERTFEKYRDIDENQRDEYYFREAEFDTLGERLSSANMPAEAIEFCKLIPDSENAREMIEKLRKAIE